MLLEPRLNGELVTSHRYFVSELGTIVGISIVESLHLSRRLKVTVIGGVSPSGIVLKSETHLIEIVRDMLSKLTLREEKAAIPVLVSKLSSTSPLKGSSSRYEQVRWQAVLY